MVGAGVPPMKSPQSPPASPTEEARWFAEQVQPHESALKSWLRARFPRLLEVDDVVQEAIFRIWRMKRNAPGDAGPKSSKAMLFAIARNTVIDAARRRQVVQMDAVADIEQLSVLDHTDVVETVSTRQELEFLADALRDLPERCRQVITLTKIYGYTEREVAERLGISEHTVRTQVVRGMQRCTEYLRRRGVSRDHR